jgi:putative copper export protein
MTHLFISLWHGGLILLPIIGFLVTAYCAYRFSKNRSRISFWIGILLATLSIIGLVAILSDK